MNKSNSILLGIGLALLLSQSVLAQERDTIAPIIKDSTGSVSSIADQNDGEEIFEIEVTDNIGVESVVLHYRFSGQVAYRSKNMNALDGQPNLYVAKLEISEADTAKIEYYFDAEDTSGNFSLKGQAFNPLVRQLILIPPIAGGSADQALEQPETQGSAPTKSESKGSKVLYYVLGALALGALAAAAGSGGGSESPQEQGCDSSGCQVDFILKPAQ